MLWRNMGTPAMDVTGFSKHWYLSTKLHGVLNIHCYENLKISHVCKLPEEKEVKFVTKLSASI